MERLAYLATAWRFGRCILIIGHGRTG